MKRGLLAGTILALAATIAQAQTPSTPQMINYQGRLTDINGVPAVTGNYTLIFNIYADKSGGAPVWGPLVFDGATSTGHGPRIPVVNGHFNVFLGPVDTSNRSITMAFTQPTRYLGIKVTTETLAPPTLPELAPRQQLLCSPYALQSYDSDTLGHGKVAVGTGAASGQITVNTRTSVGAGYTSLGAPANGLIVEGNVGIGTDVPGANKLAVNGNVRVDGVVEAVSGGVSFFMVPRRAIIMWSGTLATIPAGWALCDGNNGTPNLTNRFIYGVGPTENPGATGDTSNHSHYYDVPGFNVAQQNGWMSWVAFWCYDAGGATGAHYHWADPPAAWTAGTQTLPPYFKLAYIMKL
jgi:hypothetical protein